MTRTSYNPSGSNYGIAQLPGFVESVRLLVAREQYCATDVALMFGVSRERIRQLIAKHHIPIHHYPKGLKATRLWDDHNHRFYPVSRGAVTQETTRAITQARKAAHRRKYLARWANAAAVLRELAEELGHTPCQRELAKRLDLNPNPSSLHHHLLGSTKAGGNIWRLWLDAGLIRGISHRPRTSHCKHGHPRTRENVTNRGSCRACKRAYENARYQRRKARTPTETP